MSARVGRPSKQILGILDLLPNLWLRGLEFGDL